LASLEGIDAPTVAPPVIGLDEVEALDGEVDPGGSRRRADTLARFLVGQLEIAGRDASALEPDTLDRRDRGCASARLEILRDQALRVLRRRGKCRAAEQQRRDSETHRHLEEPPPNQGQAWNGVLAESSSNRAVDRAAAHVRSQRGRSRNHLVRTYFVPRRTFIP